ncbi:CHAT domain-containing protein [candidate division KSB1 bacterium]|nr:CHAT domain-containing protein [candidate division KSB1 bacterium]
MKLVNFPLIISILMLMFSLNTFATINDNSNFPLDELIALGHQFPEKNYFDIAYTNIEMAKNLYVQQLIMDCMADSELQELNGILREYKSLLQKETKFLSDTDSPVNVDSLNYYQKEIEEFKYYITETSPQYALFLLSHHPIKLKKIQNVYLEDREALLNYRIEENHTLVFVVLKDTFHVVTCNIGRNEIFEKTTRLMTPLHKIRNPLELDFNLVLAHELYRKLFMPIESFLTDIKSIIIIPDDVMVGFPFGCLIVDPTTGKRDSEEEIMYAEFEKMTFLIQKYAIGYNFTSLALDPVFLKPRAKEKLGRKLLTMTDVIGADPADIVSEDEWDYQSPAYGKEEAEHISRILWRHENISAENATVEYFKENSHRFRWIYLAAPAFLNNENPEKSRILFSGKDIFAYSRLKIADVLNCSLRTDLLTITGCQLSPIDIHQKPGAIVMPQAFLMAGAQSVLYNLWRVQDRSVIYLMSKFYFELKYKRQTNSMALQRAKIASLQDTFILNGHKISRAHPYFWASYVLTGNVNIRPPTFSTIPPNIVIIIVYLIVAFISLLIVRKTMQRRE